MRAVVLCVSFFIWSGSMAQSAEDSVKELVNNLFTAMRTGDSVMLKSCFSSTAYLQTIVQSKDGNVSVKNEPLKNFISSVATQFKGSLDERITFDMIKIDGNLASVWTPYNFYYSGKFSHCGVNSFQLVKLKNSWKIQYLIDTRNKTGCNP